MERKAKILIVDDDVDFVESIKTVLDTGPYDVTVAYEGEEGLQKAKDENPDLILLDVIMPIKDGFTTVEQLKKDPKLSHIPVLMLTAFGTQAGKTTIPRSRGLTLDAEGYIEKPVNPKNQLLEVAKALKKSRS